MSAFRCFLLTCLQWLLAVLLFCLSVRPVIQVSLWLWPLFRSSCPNYVYILLIFLICTAWLLHRPLVLITQLFPWSCHLTCYFACQLRSILDKSHHSSIMEITAANNLSCLSFLSVPLLFPPLFFFQSNIKFFSLFYIFPDIPDSE